ncbi:MAG: porin [Prevotella sp.]|nr:porin [Prevotella sp.]
MTNRKWLALLLLGVLSSPHKVVAQDDKHSTTPRIEGTIRAKYEYQTEEGEGRFEVRNARVSVTGNVNPVVSYKAEIDLSDEGRIRMLDAYGRMQPWSTLRFTIGQMRVPFTIDAHRSPHLQYFANRSFIAKQVANVRDVGFTAGYTYHVGFPIVFEGGFFNGSGLTNQKDFWSKQINFSAKLQAFLPQGFYLTLSSMKTKPADVTVMHWDVGTYFHRKGLHLEAEYLLKHYGGGAFSDVHTVNTFASYDIPLRRTIFSKISPLVRYDFMTDHSDGKRYVDLKEDATGNLIVNDYQRHRVTGGVTLSTSLPFVADIRINYEKYFYRSGAVVKPSEKDKIVVELMTRF